MEFGIDKNGHVVRHTDAIFGNVYLCPSCTEQVVRVRGEKACFKHKSKPNRTPLERSCPEYHESKSWQIKDPSDIVYISNGGVPLYLCNMGEEFELRAYFPSIRDICAQKFIDDQTKIIIDGNISYNASDLSYYVVNTIKDWIQVDAEPEISYKEIQRRWLWGIRGVDIDKDLYYAYEEGGYRLAVNAKVYVGKKYRWLSHKDEVSYVDGIQFKKVGSIWLIEGRSNKCYFVYELYIKEHTEAVRQFVESRGYHLCEKVNNILPLWPPAAKRGNELSVDSNELSFFHSSNARGEAVYEVRNGSLREVYGRNIYHIKGVDVMSEITLLITNTINLDAANKRSVSEIKYLLMYDDELCDVQFFEPRLGVEDIQGNLIECDMNQEIVPQEGKIFIKGNVPIKGQVFKEGYCIYSGTNILEHIGDGTEVVLSARGFGYYKYKWRKKILTEEANIDVDWKTLGRKLYRCTGATMKPTSRNRLLLRQLSKQDSKEVQYIYHIVHKWIQREAVPVSAQAYLEEILHKGKK